MSRLQTFLDNRGISSVVGIALMVGIVVVAGGVIGYAVFGIGVGTDSAPPRSVEPIDNGDGTVTFILQGGEPISPDAVDQLRVTGDAVSSVTAWLGNSSATGTTYTLDEEIRPGDDIVTVAVDGNGSVTIAQDGDASGIIGGFNGGDLPSGDSGSADSGSETNTVTSEPNADEVLATMAGNGTVDNPHQVTNISQLHAVRNASEEKMNIQLQNDIDASGTAQWNNGSGWDPLVVDQYADDAFSLDGNGHTISGLTIDRPDARYPVKVGLIREVENEDQVIEDLAVTNADVTGADYTGIIAGAGEMTMSNVEVSGTVSAPGAQHVGGVQGRIEGVSERGGTDITADVTVEGQKNLGGVYGSKTSAGEMSDIQVTATIVGNDGDPEYSDTLEHIGLVAGKTDTETLTNIEASGSIQVEEASGSNEAVGGLVGRASSLQDANDIQVDATITGNAREVGGVVGLYESDGSSGDVPEIERVTAEGTIDVNNNSVGGAIGKMEPDTKVIIGDSAIRTSVSTDGDYAAGVVGEQFTDYGSLNLTITDTYVASPQIESSNNTAVIVSNQETEYDASINVATTNVYYDSEATGISSSENATALTTSEMQGDASKTNMSGFDFSSVWDAVTGDYPELV